MSINNETLEVRVGRYFEIDDSVLPLTAETQYLQSKITYNKIGLMLIDYRSVDKNNEGKLGKNIYVFQAKKKGNYVIHLYFKSILDENKWIPEKQSSFYGRHEKKIKVNIFD